MLADPGNQYTLMDGEAEKSHGLPAVTIRLLPIACGTAWCSGGDHGFYGDGSSGQWIGGEQVAAGVRVVYCYAAYISGEEPAADSWALDFSEWASVYQTWLARQVAYRNEVQRLQHGTPSLAGLIRVTA